MALENRLSAFFNRASAVRSKPVSTALLNTFRAPCLLSIDAISSLKIMMYSGIRLWSFGISGIPTGIAPAGCVVVFMFVQ